jgi:hypothetical protein
MFVGFVILPQKIEGFLQAGWFVHYYIKIANESQG